MIEMTRGFATVCVCINKDPRAFVLWESEQQWGTTTSDSSEVTLAKLHLAVMTVD